MTLGVLAAAAASSTASNDVEPGVLGFLVVAGIAVALVFLLRSMNKQFRKIEPPPDDAGPDGAPGGDGDGGAQAGAQTAAQAGAQAATQAGAPAKAPAQTPD